MIDWQVKVQELKQTADELDLWAAKSDGRQRTVLGRIADELRQFAAQIHRELVPPDALQSANVPDWLSAIVEPPVETDLILEEGEAGYTTDGEQWIEDSSEHSIWNTDDSSYG